MCITNGFTVFVGGSFTGSDFVAAYITLPLFAAIYVGHRYIYKRAGFKTPFARPIDEIDITTGLKEAQEVEDMFPERLPRNWLEKVWFGLPKRSNRSGSTKVRFNEHKSQTSHFISYLFIVGITACR